MNRRLLLSLFACLGLGATLGASPAATDLLTVGKPAPLIDHLRFLKGEPVTSLARGTVYVVEFSGTHCAPCLAAMPYLADLQKEYPAIIFISVYSEAEDDVRPFLIRHEQSMKFRVALDPEHIAENNWQKASMMLGVPTFFLVGPDGLLAWIGHDPAELNLALKKVLSGGLDLKSERIRTYFEQADHQVIQNWAQRQKRALETDQSLIPLLQQGRWTEMIRDCEQAARDFPELESHFLTRKLYALADNPQTTDAALKYAAELSATIRHSSGDLESRGLKDAQIARALLRHEKNTDPLLAQAATILLSKAEEALVDIKDPEQRLLEKKLILELSAMAAEQRKDFAKAAALTREAIALWRGRECHAANDSERKEWESHQQSETKIMQKQLAAYERAAATQPKKLTTDY